MKRIFSALKNLFSKKPKEGFDFEKIDLALEDDEQRRRVRKYEEKFHGDKVNRPLQKFGTTFGNIMVEVVEDDKLNSEVKRLLNFTIVSRLLEHLLKNLVNSYKVQRLILEGLLQKLIKDEEGVNVSFEVDENYEAMYG